MSTTPVSFDEFFWSQIQPIYAASIDPERLRRAKAMPWQFLWMFLAVLLTGALTWHFKNPEVGLMVFVGMLMLAEMLYLYDYPYSKEESMGFFVPMFTVLFCIGGFFFLYLSGNVGANLAGIGLLLGSIAITVMQNPTRAALTRPYESLKSEVIDLFLKQFFPGFQWVNTRSLEVSTLENMGIFETNFDEVNSGYAIEGPLGDSRVMIEQLELIQVTRSKNTTTRTTVFKGFLLSANADRNQQPVVAVRPHRGLGIIDAFITEGHRIEMEDPLFERHFDVMCTDEFAARRLLSPALMGKLTHFAECQPALSGIWFGHQTISAVKHDGPFFGGDYSVSAEVREELRAVQLNLDKMLEILIEIL